jgi:hypothetical protein
MAPESDRGLFPIAALQAPVWETSPGMASPAFDLSPGIAGQPEPAPGSGHAKPPQTIAETPVTARPTMSELISNDPS